MWEHVKIPLGMVLLDHRKLHLGYCEVGHIKIPLGFVGSVSPSTLKNRGFQGKSRHRLLRRQDK